MHDRHFLHVFHCVLNACARAVILATLALGLLLATSVQATSPRPFPPMDKPMPNWVGPTVTLRDTGAQAVQLRQVDIRTEVFAGQAQTRIDMRLFNPNNRVLEGELQFPLLDGQTVTGFALDVNGAMRDAVPVPKARGQEIFEDISRRRVDPGLLESTAANQYKLRVYPIPAQGERRVVLTVMESLSLRNGQLHLQMPLVFSTPVAQLNVAVTVTGQPANALHILSGPQGIEKIPQWNGTQLKLSQTAWTGKDAASRWLRIAMAASDKPQILTGESAGQHYFAGQFAFKDQLVKRPVPKHIALVWDASASAAAQNPVRPVLDAYLRSLPASTRLSLLVVRNRTQAIQTFSLGADGMTKLADVLRAEPLDGSTNFDSLPIPADVDATLMVTDGIMTDGRRQLNYTHSAPVFVLNAAAVADLPRLRRLAERTGGALIDVSTQTAEQAIHAMQWHGWHIAQLRSFSASQLVPASLQVASNRLSIAGKLDGMQAQVDVVLRHPSGQTRVVTLQVKANGDGGRWPAQQWANWRSQELAENPTLYSTELQRIATEHGLVGPNSSLIVLEQAADYARYDLPAPADIADEVMRLKASGIAVRQQDQKQHIEAMVRQFTERQRWWEKDFPKLPPLIEAAVKREPTQETTVAAMGSVQQPHVRAPAAVPPAAAAIPSPAAPVPMSAQPRAAPAAVAAPPMPSAPAPAPAATTAQKSSSTTSTIALQAWVPNAPYMARLRSAADADLYRVYLDERENYRLSSAFVLDVAALFQERGQSDLMLRILSNLGEMNIENRQLLRLYGYRLMQTSHADAAIPVFDRITQLAPNEPQSWRDFGLALADTGQSQRAVNALWEVVSRPWNGRFEGVNLIALTELNAIAATSVARGYGAVDLSGVDSRLIRNLPLDLRISMAWDTDNTDIDLHVTDPDMHTANYGFRLTPQGGAMSADARGGYGPEDYSLKIAKPGRYVISAKFYGNRQQVLSAGTTVMVRVSKGFGTPEWKDQWLTVRMTEGGEMARIGEVSIP